MAKFDGRAAARLPVPLPDTVTHQGGEGFLRPEKQELVLLGISNVVSEDTFYETGAQRDDRFASLVRQVTISDPEWVRAFAKWLRSDANMRSASIVVAAEYVAAGGQFGRGVVDSVLQRADEPGEMLAYWRSAHGRNIPMAVKRGVADATQRLYTERNLLRYDGSGRSWRWGDVVEVVHPKPASAWQSDLFRYAIERRQNRGTEPSDRLETLRLDAALMAVPEAERRSRLDDAIAAGWNWDRLGSWLPGGLDAQAWEAVIPNMGAMALVRNLRNFDEAGISAEAVAEVTRRLTDPEEIARSRQLPLRFLSAWKNVQSLRWGDALETALNHSLSNVPHFEGRTLVLVDVSGSMGAYAMSGGRGKGASPHLWEVASLFGLAVAHRSDKADVFTFDTSPRPLEVKRGASILRGVTDIGHRVGGGTNTLGSLMAAYNGQDRVVILTDEQTGYSGYYYGSGYGARYQSTLEQAKQVVGERTPVTTFNLAGYQSGHSPVDGKWLTIGGLNDASFGILAHGVTDTPWR